MERLYVYHEHAAHMSTDIMHCLQVTWFCSVYYISSVGMEPLNATSNMTQC